MKILTIAALLVFPLSAFCETEEFIFDLSGQQNRHLKVNVLHGGMVVRGYDGDQVKVTVKFDEVELPELTAGDSGMRSLPNLANDLQANRDGGTVILRAGTEYQPVQLAVKVPMDAHLTLTVSQGGDIKVYGVAGEMELQNSSGKIVIDDIRNTVVAHAHSDDLSASFAITELPGASTFSSWSGNVELSLPASVKADLRWRSNYGEVLSDLAVMNMRTISMRKDSSDSARVEGYTVASVNGGGPEISATSYSGNVIFKKITP